MTLIKLCFSTSTGKQEEFCCHGYVIDLLVELSQKVNFTYDLHLVEDNNYGTFEMVILDISLVYLLGVFTWCIYLVYLLGVLLLILLSMFNVVNQFQSFSASAYVVNITLTKACPQRQIKTLTPISSIIALSLRIINCSVFTTAAQRLINNQKNATDTAINARNS